MTRPQCDAEMFYGTAESGRRLADGVKRFMKENRCLKPAAYEGRGYLRWKGEKSYWCGTHAKNSHVRANYGPMKRLPRSHNRPAPSKEAEP